MRDKTVRLSCSHELARGLATALRAFAQAAYPPGGSECAQAARAALLDTAAQCEAHTDGVLVLRRRLMPQLRAAVRWSLSLDGPREIEWPPGLGTLLEPDKQSSC